MLLTLNSNLSNYYMQDLKKRAAKIAISITKYNSDYPELINFSPSELLSGHLIKNNFGSTLGSNLGTAKNAQINF